MENTHQRSSILLIFIALFLLISCSKENTTEEKAEVNSKSFQSYTHDGLTLRYPDHWKFAYDETPSIYADRAVAFDTSESSRVSVFVYKDKAMTAEKVANIFIRQFRVGANEYIKDYQQNPIEIQGLSGIKISWQDVMIGSFPVEVTILDLAKSPDAAFVVSQLHNEDISKDSVNLIPFAFGVSFK